MALYNVNDSFVKAPAIYYRGQQHQQQPLEHQGMGRCNVANDDDATEVDGWLRCCCCCWAENFIVWLFWPYRIYQFMVMAPLDGAYTSMYIIITVAGRKCKKYEIVNNL